MSNPVARRCAFSFGYRHDTMSPFLMIRERKAVIMGEAKSGWTVSV